MRLNGTGIDPNHTVQVARDGNIIGSFSFSELVLIFENPSHGGLLLTDHMFDPRTNTWRRISELLTTPPPPPADLGPGCTWALFISIPIIACILFRLVGKVWPWEMHF